MSGEHQYSPEERQSARQRLIDLRSKLEKETKGKVSVATIADLLNEGAPKGAKVTSETVRKALLDEPVLGRKLVARLEAHLGEPIRATEYETRYPEIDALVLFAQAKGYDAARIAAFRGMAIAFKGPIDAAKAAEFWKASKKRVEYLETEVFNEKGDR